VQATDEATWVRQAQAGDRDAFAKLVKFYWSRLFRWLFEMSRCAHSAEDLTQETFIRAWQALPNYRNEHFRAWLYKIARNALIDDRRSRKTKAIDPLPANPAGKEPEPLSNLLTEEHRQSVEMACQLLPEVVRSAFLLFVHEEMPYHEIAEVLDITEVTARWRVCKARKLLLRQLKSQGEEPRAK
jgi:RNA polymerase sigma-70 factor (ECF subfamily)